MEISLFTGPHEELVDYLLYVVAALSLERMSLVVTSLREKYL